MSVIRGETKDILDATYTSTYCSSMDHIKCLTVMREPKIGLKTVLVILTIRSMKWTHIVNFKPANMCTSINRTSEQDACKFLSFYRQLGGNSLHAVVSVMQNWVGAQLGPLTFEFEAALSQPQVLRSEEIAVPYR